MKVIMINLASKEVNLVARRISVETATIPKEVTALITVSGHSNQATINIQHASYKLLILTNRVVGVKLQVKQAIKVERKTTTKLKIFPLLILSP